MTCETWHGTCDTWHVTCDTWHVTFNSDRWGEVNLLSKLRIHSFNGQKFRMFWILRGKGWISDWINEWLIDKGVWRTALATPGLYSPHLSCEGGQLLSFNLSKCMNGLNALNTMTSQTVYSRQSSQSTGGLWRLRLQLPVQWWGGLQLWSWRG